LEDSSLKELFGDDRGWIRGDHPCSEDPNLFFDESESAQSQAKRMCRGCDVRAECLNYAVAYRERAGIWGGMTERERRRRFFSGK